MSIVRFISKILNNSYTTLVVAILAIFVARLFPEFGKSLTFFKDIFLTLISISVIPIIFSSITCSITLLLSNKSEKVSIPKMIFTFSVILFLAGIIGISVGVISNPAKSVMNSDIISTVLFSNVKSTIAELSIYDAISSIKNLSLSDFLSTLLPKNPFAAFAQGNIIQIISLSILCGIAIAHLETSKKETAVNNLTILMQSFKKILKIPTKILPIGMFFVIASSISKTNINDIFAMKYFIFWTMLSFFTLILIALLLFAIYSPIGIFASIRAIKESVFIAFSTCSNQATLPFLIVALKEKFKLSEQSVNVSIPIGITMCRVSNVAYYAFVSIFIAQIYNQPLSIYEYGFISLGAIITSFSSSGVNGIIAISMISIIMDPLNLPIDAIIVILIAIDPIIDPIRTITSLVMNAALSCFIINSKRENYANTSI